MRQTLENNIEKERKEERGKKTLTKLQGKESLERKWGRILIPNPCYQKGILMQKIRCKKKKIIPLSLINE